MKNKDMSENKEKKRQIFNTANIILLSIAALMMVLNGAYMMIVNRSITNTNTAVNEMIGSFTNGDKYREFGCHSCMNIVFNAGKKGSVSSAIIYDLYAMDKFPMYNDYASQQMDLPLIPVEIDRSPQVHPDYNSDYIFEAMRGEQVSFTIISMVDHINKYYQQIPEKHQATFAQWQAQADKFRKRNAEQDMYGVLLTAWYNASVMQDTYFVSNPAKTFTTFF